MSMFTLSKETRDMLVSMICLTAVTALVLLLFGRFDFTLYTGLVFGAAVSFLDFYLLERSVKTAVILPPKSAYSYALSRYILRYLLTALAVLASVTLPFLHAATTVVALFFPKVIIISKAFVSVVRKKGDDAAS